MKSITLHSQHHAIDGEHLTVAEAIDNSTGVRLPAIRFQ